MARAALRSRPDGGSDDTVPDLLDRTGIIAASTPSPRRAGSVRPVWLRLPRQRHGSQDADWYEPVAKQHELGRAGVIAWAAGALMLVIVFSGVYGTGQHPDPPVDAAGDPVPAAPAAPTTPQPSPSSTPPPQPAAEQAPEPEPEPVVQREPEPEPVYTVDEEPATPEARIERPEPRATLAPPVREMREIVDPMMRAVKPALEMIPPQFRGR